MKTTKVLNIDVDKVEYTLDHAHESIACLLAFIIACGYDSNHKEYKRIEFLIFEQEHVSEWLEFYDGDIENISETTDKLEDARKQSLRMTLLEFVTICEENLQIGLEKLFQAAVSVLDLKKLREKLHSMELTLEKIYSTAKENNWYNTAGKFARSNWT